MHFSQLTYAGLVLAPSALGANLIASHYSGKLFSLTYTPSGNNAGNLAIAGSVTGCGNQPSWISLDSASGTLLCTDESYGSGAVSTFSVSNTGALTLNGTAKTSGGDVHGSFYGGSDGKGFVVMAEYDPSTISTYKLPLTSSSPRLQTLKFTGSGPISSRQTAAHPHSAFTGPNGDYLIVPDLGSDLIRIFSINRSSGQLTSCPAAKTNAGDGPRHGTWWSPSGSSSTNGLMLYTVNELSNTVSAWSTSYPSGGCLTLTRTQTLSTYAAGKAPPSTLSNPSASNPAKAAEVHVSGNFLYAANRNDQSFGSQQDSLATFSINPATGALTFVENTSAHGWYPRTFSINKAGDLLAVGGQTTSNVAIVARNTTTGRLGNLLASVQIASPGTSGAENGLSAVVWDE